MRTILMAFACCLPTFALADDDRKGPPNAFFTGDYEIVGRMSGQSPKAYFGIATFREEGERLAVSRCIGGKVTKGYLKYSEWGRDRLMYLKGTLDDNTSVTCEFSVDNSNYALLSCAHAPLDQPRTETPGLEFYVTQHWMRSDESKTCG